MTAFTNPTVPEEFIGVWERVEISVDRTIMANAGRSFWLQGSSRYLDVRCAGNGIQSEAFAGVTTWDEPTQALSWRHDLDLHPGTRTDVGRVEWRDGHLIEHGSAETAGGTIGYTEVWHRRSNAGAEMMIADRVGGSGRLAMCDEHVAVLVDGRPSGTLRAGHGIDRGWAVVFDIVLGRPPTQHSSPPPPPAIPANQPFEQLDQTWTVVERATSSSNTQQN